ncbi:NAD dependent epimerase/dehydratase family protein-like protein [Ophiobolus disseminans]|uniref:NAD dependent epimerase/dehydratase family protein-like protein n=1 Tax=Ophiobolus disseminans TaxID=1469910 RepID=A0A6A6ZW85_9PLEO|nr:NAD dependent epimerase/dehydratase family protein-like protein [Ophiobolus disseminans]
MSTAVLVGSTGQVGASILTYLLAHPSFTAIYAYARRDLPNFAASTKLNPITSSDTSQWASIFPREMHPKIMFSGLGTTRAAAGSVEAQRKVDYDLNMELATAAKDAGVETYVLISTTGASATSRFAYPKMKGELEDSVKALKFKHTVILRPGFIAGDRTSRESGVAEVALRWVAKGLGSVSPALKNPWAQDGELIARAAVAAGVKCLEGKQEEGVWEIGQSGVVSLGAELEKK